MHITRWLGALFLIGTIAACTVPPRSPAAVAPAAPIGARVLVPTPESVGDGAEVVVNEADSVDSTTVDADAMESAPAASPLSAEQIALLAKLPSRGAAPELHNETWVNSEPLKLADLRGNVVIVEFWTYG